MDAASHSELPGFIWQLHRSGKAWATAVVASQLDDADRQAKICLSSAAD